jgi:hypothetical protein
MALSSILNPPGKMITDDNTNLRLDVESTDHEQPAQSVSEIDPLMGNDVKEPTKQEARVARAQFLALCWTLFVLGWNDGSTGPLLPRIQEFYDVNSFGYFFFNVDDSAGWV